MTAVTCLIVHFGLEQGLALADETSRNQSLLFKRLCTFLLAHSCSVSPCAYHTLASTLIQRGWETCTLDVTLTCSSHTSPAKIILAIPTSSPTREEEMLISRQKGIHSIWFHLYKISGIGRLIDTDSRLEVPRDWGDNGTEFSLWGGPGYRVAVGHDEKVLETGSGKGSTTLWL